MTTDELIEFLQRHPGLPVKVEVRQRAQRYSMEPDKLTTVHVDNARYQSAEGPLGRTCVKLSVEL